MVNMEWIIELMNDHAIYTKIVNGKLYALEISKLWDDDRQEWLDTTHWVRIDNWTRRQLYSWLGY